MPRVFVYTNYKFVALTTWLTIQLLADNIGIEPMTK